MLAAVCSPAACACAASSNFWCRSWCWPSTRAPLEAPDWCVPRARGRSSTPAARHHPHVSIHLAGKPVAHHHDGGRHHRASRAAAEHRYRIQRAARVDLAFAECRWCAPVQNRSSRCESASPVALAGSPAEHCVVAQVFSLGGYESRGSLTPAPAPSRGLSLCDVLLCFSSICRNLKPSALPSAPSWHLSTLRAVKRLSALRVRRC